MSDSIKLSPKHGLNATIPRCFWCGRDKNMIALMGKIDRQDSQAPMGVIMDYEPCDECKELFSKGIHVIGVTDKPVVKGMFPILQDDKNTFYPTGSMFVAKEEFIERFLKANDSEEMLEDVLEKKVLLMPSTLVDEIVADSKAAEMEVEQQEAVEDENN